MSEVWDGTLEDGRVLRAARDALDAWRQASRARGDTSSTLSLDIDPGLRVAALGAGILDFASGDSSAALTGRDALTNDASGALS